MCLPPHDAGINAPKDRPCDKNTHNITYYVYYDIYECNGFKQETTQNPCRKGGEKESLERFQKISCIPRIIAVSETSRIWMKMSRNPRRVAISEDGTLHTICVTRLLRYGNDESWSDAIIAKRKDGRKWQKTHTRRIFFIRFFFLVHADILEHGPLRRSYIYIYICNARGPGTGLWEHFGRLFGVRTRVCTKVCAWKPAGSHVKYVMR